MTGQFKVILALVLAAASILAGVFLYRAEKERQREVSRAGTETISPEPLALAEPDAEKTTAKVYLYSPNSKDPGRPVFYSRNPEIAADAPPAVRAREIVDAVLKGSRNIVPGSVRLLEFYLLKDGTAVVDLSREVTEGLVGSVEAEMGLLEALTRSLRENLPEIRRVKFVVEGQEKATLAGHVSIQAPFR